jgi:two-component system, response regulator, stage 0 sporulation protein A
MQQRGDHSLRKIKIFIADQDTYLMEGIRTVIDAQKDMEVVAATVDGNSCLKSEHLPTSDLLILHDILPEIDGLSLLNKINLEMERSPAVILLTSFLNSYVQEQAMHHGVNMMMEKPIDILTLLQNIRSIFFEGKQKKAAPVTSKVESYLTTFGIPRHLTGYLYLSEILRIVAKDESLLHSMRKDVFPKISKKYKTSAKNIENRIYYAIQAGRSQNQHSQQLYAKAFGNYPPSVKDFITFAVYAIQD